MARNLVRWDLDASVLVDANVLAIARLLSDTRSLRFIGISAGRVLNPALLLATFRNIYLGKVGENLKAVSWDCQGVNIYPVLRESPRVECISMAVVVEEPLFTTIVPPTAYDPEDRVTFPCLRALDLTANARRHHFGLDFSSLLLDVVVDDYPLLERFELRGTAVHRGLNVFLAKNCFLRVFLLHGDALRIGGFNRVQSLPFMHTFGLPLALVPRFNIRLQPSLKRVILFNRQSSLFGVAAEDTTTLGLTYLRAVESFVNRMESFPSLEDIVFHDFPFTALRDVRWSARAVAYLREAVRVAARKGVRILDGDGCYFFCRHRLRPAGGAFQALGL